MASSRRCPPLSMRCAGRLPIRTDARSRDRRRRSRAPQRRPPCAIGGAARRATRSSSGRSSTATATGSATSEASRRSSTTSTTATRRTNRDLGARCIWLMPVNEASSYHGYDATDYYRVEQDYGTNDDFKRLVAEAHRRGIAVLVDMVLNHVVERAPLVPGSVRRAWCRASRRGSDGRRRGPPNGARGARRCGTSRRRGTSTTTACSGTACPTSTITRRRSRVKRRRSPRSGSRTMGVDGFRLDAVPYLVDEPGQQVGTAGTHAFLREYAASVRALAPDAFTVGEVWDGLDRMLPYYPDQLESYFAFDLSDLLIAAVRDGSPQPAPRAIHAVPAVRSPTRATRRSCGTTIRRGRSPRWAATSPARESRPRCCSRFPACRSSITARRSG